jgi:SAM-dependent methyltransferase
MAPWPDLTVRSAAAELMDDPSIGGEELTTALRQLRLINRLLFAARPTVEGVAWLWGAAGCPRRLSILDVGAGSGDGCRALLGWAVSRGVDMDITLLDIHPETCAEAERFFRDEPRVRARQGDLFALEPGAADIVTAALVLHHFPEPLLGHALQALARAARLGVVVNDLHRSIVAWGGIRLATGIFSRNRMIRHDAPLSVARGFREADLRRLQQLAGLERLTYGWRPLWRWLVIIEKEGSREGSALP